MGIKEIIKLIVVIIVGLTLTFLGIDFLIESSQKGEAERFWECDSQGGTVEYCVKAFEKDALWRIEKFNECLIEIDNLKYCHQKFLVEFN